MIGKRWMKQVCAVLAISAVGGWMEAEGAAYVVRNNGARVDGTAIRANRQGDIILTQERGTVEFPRGSYREARAPRPAEMDQAVRQLRDGNMDDAIRTLQTVERNYQFLGWDIDAIALMARAYTESESYREAVSSYERLFEKDGSKRTDSAIRWGYYAALLGANQYDQLEGILSELISDRAQSREDAARAQLMRGDMKMQRQRYEDALLDYLRTVLLFERQTSVQAEALFKAGTALAEMRDPRARDMFRRVVEQHGNSPFAQQARQRM